MSRARKNISAQTMNRRVGVKMRAGLDEHGVSGAQMKRAADEALKRLGVKTGKVSPREAFIHITYSAQTRAAVGR